MCVTRLKTSFFEQFFALTSQNNIYIMLQVNNAPSESVTYVEKIQCHWCRVVRAPHCSGGQNRLLRRDGQSREGGKVTPYIWEKFGFTALTGDVDVVESLWVRTGGQKTKISLWMSALNYPARMIVLMSYSIGY